MLFFLIAIDHDVFGARAGGVDQGVQNLIQAKIVRPTTPQMIIIRGFPPLVECRYSDRRTYSVWRAARVGEYSANVFLRFGVLRLAPIAVRARFPSPKFSGVEMI